MCSIFVPLITNMDNYQGDLTDIIRATATATAGTSSSPSEQQPPAHAAPPQQQHHHHDIDHWHHHHHHHQFSSHDPMMSGSSFNPFGDPFSTMRDPFLQELDIMPPITATTVSSSNSYFNNNTTSTTSTNNNPTSSSCSVFAHNKVVVDHSSRPPCKNIFSNMIQISPNNAKLLPVLPYHDSSSSSSPAVAMAPSPRAIKPSAVVSPNMTINASSKDSLLVQQDNTCTAAGGGGGGVQISSPRNPGLKRRKNQAKKVVCIPAPAAANSRQTGEVVPSDLWAWRKYGQKPIKGSPYPRGYYRCSSSKGCSARKQVERSRTDPNMLVITYTSEHNHPWPTQRNALAGSTRSQPSKNNNNNDNASSSSKNSETSQKGTTVTTTKPKEEDQQQQQEISNNSTDIIGCSNINSPLVNNSSSANNSVKEEMEEDIEKVQLEMEEGISEFSDGVVLPYKPSMMNMDQNSNIINQSHEDFFAELGEIETDPLNLLFTQDHFADPNNPQRESNVKALDDPFHLFDWSGEDHTNNTNNSFEEPNIKRRL